MPNPEHLAKLTITAGAFNQWRQDNPKEQVDLKDAVLTDMNLSEYDLSNARFDRARLYKINLHHANLEGANFDNALLSEVGIENARLSKAQFVRSFANGIKFDGSTGVDVNFESSSLIGAMFHRVQLPNSSFVDANLSEAIMDNAQIIGSNLTKSNCVRTRFSSTNLRTSTISNADFFEAIFDGPDLSEIIGAPSAKHLETSDCKRERYFENCQLSWTESRCDWEAIKRFGRLPLFALSYSVLIFIPLYIYVIAFYNSQVDAAHAWAEKIHVSAPSAAEFTTNHLHRMPMPGLSFWLLISTGLLAIASTIYTFACPPRIKEFSKEIWTHQLNKPLPHYWPLSWKYRRLRLVCAFCYVVGGLMALTILGIKVFKAGRYIFEHVSIL